MVTPVSLNIQKKPHLTRKQNACFMRFSKKGLTIQNLTERKIETYICRASSLVFLSVVRPYQEDFRFWNIGKTLVIEKKPSGITLSVPGSEKIYYLMEPKPKKRKGA